MSQLKAIQDLLLTQVSSAYIPQGAVCEQLLPEITSAMSTGKLGKYGSSHLRIEKSLKGGRGGYRRVESITRSTSSFSIEGHGLEGIVTKEDYKNVQLPFKAEEDETIGISTMLLLEKEQTLASTLTNSSIVTQNTSLSGTSQYSDPSGGDPIDNFAVARSTIRAACGVEPNVAVMDWAVYNQLRFNPKLMDTLGFKYNRPGGLRTDELAIALDVDQLIIAKCSYNSAKEGQADSLSPVWGKHIVFGVFPDKAVPYQVSAGYMVVYENEAPRKVYKQPTFNPPESTLILVEDNYDMLISNASALYLIQNAIA